MKPVFEELYRRAVIMKVSRYVGHDGYTNRAAWSRRIRKYNLKNIALINCPILGDEGTKAVVELLKFNTSVTHLTLQHCNIGDEGAKAIGEVLKLKKISWSPFISV